MLKVDEYIMYKKYVCKIKDIKKKNNQDYYVLSPIEDNSLTINIPVDTSDASIRTIISKEKIDEIISSAPNVECINPIIDKSIEHEYKELLNNGDYTSLVKIIKTTYLRNKARIDNNKKISEKDDAYFKKAEKILYNEFSIALELSYEDTKKYVIDKIKKAIDENEK